MVSRFRHVNAENEFKFKRMPFVLFCFELSRYRSLGKQIIFLKYYIVLNLPLLSLSLNVI